eukprot:Protomagalhaensia_wolfi_Nauph_80__1125@NODE_1661_length_1411_cov_102_981050_g1287_i0_p1_GENE_NODE_1661_length_1411_cov_102_981050_g1287_i0NODE_1661_length_1411_cov_102_981050_g1287_i0_p1_ORF_typecomplete_len247_score10_26NT5C/PF06941_12/4_8e30HAD_2/PF13419_6/3e08Acid_phosphat_B/PF03767_14/0_0001NIF/PF03031_18/0_00031_NODE_1661_length_1411_cov_102_981050_g1287_i06471387
MRVSELDLPVFAIDVDEVLAATMPQITAWHNATYGTSYSVSDYKSYKFCQTWQCSDQEAMSRFVAFTQSRYWDAIEPVPGAQEFVREMKKHFRLAVVTSRQNYLQESTLKWLDKHFGLDSFFHIGFGNQWLADKDAVKVSKHDMCQQIGAVALVDDLPKYIFDVLPVVNRAVLFNPENAYGWGWIAEGVLAAEPRIAVARSWSDVLKVAFTLRRTLSELGPRELSPASRSLETVMVSEGGGSNLTM